MKTRTTHMILDQDLPGRAGRRSERGAVLLMVIVLSSIALAVMTTLIYMITVGTQISGVEKRYRTVHDAAFGGWEIMGQLLYTRGATTAQKEFTDNLTAHSLTSSVTTSAACTGTAAGKPYDKLAAKLMTASTSWSSSCSANLTIDPSAAGSYDLVMQLGSVPNSYNVYGKIVNTVEGNTGTDSGGLRGKGVVSSNSGEVSVVPRPYLYTIEVDAENASNPSERAKLSILYQY